MLLANPEDTIPPIEAGTEVLKVYGGVVYVGVGRTKLGRVVATSEVFVKLDELLSW